MQKTQERFSATLRVMSKFFDLLGALRACVDFCDPTDFSRIMGAHCDFMQTGYPLDASDIYM